VDTAIAAVVVDPNPAAAFSNTTVCETFVTDFTDNSIVSSGSITGWEWDFGDASALDFNQNPTHTYPSTGSYTVTLIVTTDNGCNDTITQPVTVNPLPVVDFDAVPLEGCQPLFVNFTDLSIISSGSNIDWDWIFGNAGSSILQNPTHIFPAVGTFDITLIVTSDQNCQTTLTNSDMITVRPRPVANFNAQPQPTDLMNPTINFSDQSTTSQGSVSGWIWDFGDGSTGSVQDPSYTYLDSGSYNVELIVNNNFGCLDTAYNTIVIDQFFTFIVPNAFSPNGDGVNDILRPVVLFGSMETISFEIFNRWGEEIFQSNGAGWDGTYQGKPQPIETYVYILKYFKVDGEIAHQSGSFTLIR
jgi:gliding motility-associated-like protein